MPGRAPHHTGSAVHGKDKQPHPLTLQPALLWVQVWEHRWRGHGGCRCRAGTTVTMIERAGGKETPPTRALCSGHHLGFLHSCVANHTLMGLRNSSGDKRGSGGLAKSSSSHYKQTAAACTQPGGHPPPGRGRHRSKVKSGHLAEPGSVDGGAGGASSDRPRPQNIGLFARPDHFLF